MRQGNPVWATLGLVCVTALVLSLLAAPWIMAPVAMAAHTTLRADDETSAVFRSQQRFWHGSESTAGKPTTPVSYLYQGPAWMNAVEAAMLGDMSFSSVYSVVDGAGVDWTTSAGLSAGCTGTLPLTITYTVTLEDSNNLDMYWLDGWTDASAWATSLTWIAAGDGADARFPFVWVPTGKNPMYTNGVASLVATVSTETLTGTTISLHMIYQGDTFAGTAVTQATTDVLYFAK